MTGRLRCIMKAFVSALALGVACAAPAFAADHAAPASGEVCTGFGPQTPRDIDFYQGENPRTFTIAPPSTEMNLCNIHFHENAEHKGSGFMLYAGDGDGHGYDSGYQCEMSKTLSTAELSPTLGTICKGEHGDLVPGDTIEVHWVYSTCDVKPGPTLSSCLSDTCKNPQLRVEAQVFTLVNDPAALDFNTLSYNGRVENGVHQPDALAGGTGRPVEFLGSTTGPSYSDQKCSPFQVTWSVRPNCAKVNINSVGVFCKGNAFNEDHAHGVRKLVTDPRLLSEIR
ncbi:MAG: cadmium carbonic anhydrase [Alphaproteobacteria bacterium]|nr:cadmium carbonic anhydrase [Alphaproteobacteria bacterium]